MKYYNFSAGPTALFSAVVEQIKEDLGNWNNTHSSIFEISHRGKEFMELYFHMESQFRKLLNVPENYSILFMHGGGRGQFAAVPFNIEKRTNKALYLTSGHWSRIAAKEGSKQLEVIEHRLTDADGNIIKLDWSEESKDMDYVFFCANETVDGIELMQDLQISKDTYLVCDMSSNILSREIDVNKYDVIIAGAQKNIGAAGVTIVIVKNDLLGKAQSNTPEILDWTVQANSESMMNTPATFSWYTCSLTFDYIINTFKNLKVLEERNIVKAQKLYSYIDQEPFYTNKISKDTRSRMNVVFQTPNDKLDSLFASEAEKQGLYYLKGHKVIGGLRASIYNHLDIDGVDALISFMKQFAEQHKV